MQSNDIDLEKDYASAGDDDERDMEGGYIGPDDPSEANERRRAMATVPRWIGTNTLPQLQESKLFLV